jgi:hypothetical protein
MGLLTGGGGPILGAIGGAIHPTPGLSVGQSIVHGLLSSVPAYRVLGTLWHAINGTAGQFGDAANNPYNHPENFGGQPTPTPPAPPPGSPTPATTSAPRAALPQGFDPASVYNALRTAFGPTAQQLMNPGSAIGPFGGGTIPYDSANWQGPRNFDHSMGPEAQALMAMLAKMQP